MTQTRPSSLFDIARPLYGITTDNNPASFILLRHDSPALVSSTLQTAASSAFDVTVTGVKHSIEFDYIFPAPNDYAGSNAVVFSGRVRSYFKVQVTNITTNKYKIKCNMEIKRDDNQLSKVSSVESGLIGDNTNDTVQFNLESSFTKVEFQAGSKMQFKFEIEITTPAASDIDNDGNIAFLHDPDTKGNEFIIELPI